MANLKEIRNRIKSVANTQQITSAMKVVSAAKLRRAQDAIIRMRPYAGKLQEILQNVSASLDGGSNQFAARKEEKKVLLVAISSNRGLAGAFNNNVIKTARQYRNDHHDQQVSILCIGKKVFEAFGKEKFCVNSKFPSEFKTIFDNLNFDYVSPLAEYLMAEFKNENFDKIIVIYNSFKNAAVQRLLAEQFLPVLPPENDGTKKSNVDYIYEPNQEAIVEDIIPKSLKIQIYKALLDSHAAEHGARMTAMHKATENASEILKELKLNYNKARQAAITAEILEIVGGAEALNG